MPPGIGYGKPLVQALQKRQQVNQQVQRSPIINQLLRQGASAPAPRTFLEGLGNNLAPTIAGAWLDQQYRRDAAGKTQAKNAALQDVLSRVAAGMGPVPGDPQADLEGIDALGGGAPVNMGAEAQPGYALMQAIAQSGDPAMMQAALGATIKQQMPPPRASKLLTPEEEEQRKRMAQAKPPLVQVNTGPDGVDYGKPEKGYVWKRDGSGKIITEPDEEGNLVPQQLVIPNGSADRSRQDAEGEKLAREAKERASRLSAQKYGRVVTDNIADARRIMRDSAFPVTGWGGIEAARNIPGASRDLAAKISTIQAGVAFERIRVMRANSPTGGALGQVSERELKLLSDSLGSLDQAQSKDELIRTLDRIEKIYEGVVNGVPDGEGGVRRITVEDLAGTRKKFTRGEDNVYRLEEGG